MKIINSGELFMRNRLFLSLVLLVGVALFVIPGCSQDEDEEPDKEDDSIVIKLTVKNDDLFGFDVDSQIGQVWISDSVGLVGSPIRCLIQIQEIEPFDENDIEVIVTLDNPDAIKLDSFEVQHVFDDESTEFEFIIPQVLTIPTMLNFHIYLNVYDAESDDYFEATGFFQFYVNQGTPAT